MTRFVIKQGLDDMSHPALQSYAQNISVKMDGNLNYTTPNPSLVDFNALLTDFSDALTAWGHTGNRGSAEQYQLLLDARAALQTGLVALSAYCTTTTPYEKTAFMSGGWDVKKETTPVGIVGPVVGLHQFISRTVPSGAVKLNWKRPAEAPRGSINCYRLLHSLTADINSATLLALTTKTTYTDLEAGNRPSNFYWVVPVCTAGAGGIADVIAGYPQGPVFA